MFSTKLIVVTLSFFFVGLIHTADDVEYINRLIARGDLLVTQGQETLKKFRSQNNYFSKALEDELIILIGTLDQLKKEKDKVNSTDPISQAFLHQAEQQLTNHENNMQDIIKVGEKNGTDPGYKELLTLVEALLDRAYRDVGYLVTHNLGSEANAIQSEVNKIGELEKQLKSINYDNSPSQAQLVIEQLLQHEQVIESEMFRIEQIKKD